jgi:hypothetical protein
MDGQAPLVGLPGEAALTRRDKARGFFVQQLLRRMGFKQYQVMGPHRPRAG